MRNFGHLLIILLVVLFICDKTSARVDNWNERYLNRPRPKSPFVNNRPIIGILSQELNAQIYRLCTLATYKSYIAASYVKFIESAGARVVPIRIGQHDSYYEEMVNSVNGIMLPGNNVQLTNTSDGSYVRVARKLYDLAISKDVPLWAIGSGFEALIYFTVGKDIRVRCNATDVSLRLKFEMDFAKSRIFRNAPFDVIQTLKNQPLAANMHNYCITVKNATKFKLDQHWLVLSLSKHNNFTFISALESRKYKIYGVHFNIEKSNFEWNRDSYVHTSEAVEVSQYFAHFFISEARKNNNTFGDKRREISHLIYNYAPLYTAKNGCPFIQCYVF